MNCCHAVAVEEPSKRLCERWEREYSGEDATGEHVLALWQFDVDRITHDASGRGHELTLDGATSSSNGRFGGGLESFRGWPDSDQRHWARAKHAPGLSPRGPFTIEMWICPNESFDAEYPSAFLVDKKYVSHDDYQLILGGASRHGSRVMQASLGFGLDSSTYYSLPVRFEPGTWYHVAFTYDGAGEGSFYLGGIPWGSTLESGRKSISPGTRFLAIGDRTGSLYHGFPGLIDQVRICDGVLEFRKAAFERVSPRACYIRNEPEAVLQFQVTNLLDAPIDRATVSVALDGSTPIRQVVTGLDAGQSTVVDYPLDTSLRPDTYRLAARLEVESPEPYVSEDSFSLRIVPRRVPHRFPVLMWGVGSPTGVLKEMDRLQEIGFTHVLGLRADYEKIWQAGAPTEAAEPEVVEATRQMLDEALANDLTIVASLSPGAAMRKKQELCRVNRDGEPYAREDICGLIDGLGDYCHNVGASVAGSYEAFPAWGAAMLHTEVRGHAAPCFHEHDREAFRRHAGFEIPPEVVRSRGVDYTKLPDFPKSRVIPDDHPLYVYYRWYWKQGDGWNGLNTRLHQGLKSTGRDDMWTYHDPAVRVASVYGTGGEVDFLSQWTYSYPDPIRIAVATDELLAMAAAASSASSSSSSHAQQVMKMTQIIWYRSQTAPEPDERNEQENRDTSQPYRARWEREQPDAAFITIAPMHLREALWTKLSRPIRGIMYHGWQSLVPCEPPGGYRFTHSQTQHELARLIREVVRPLGPTLLQVDGVPSDVAVLESFASEMFARRGTYGWNGSWAGDAYHALLYAHLQPEIVFDETVIERGLDGFRVLVMPDCDVITESMADRVRRFQASGGLVVGDERLAPAIEPDIRVPTYKRTGQADKDKAALVALAAGLRKQLDSRYRRYVDTSNPDVIPYRRRAGATDYIFLVNDRREYGQYVGQHGLVMENGLPSDAVLSVDRADGVVYDLVHGRRVSAERKADRLVMDVHLGPCDGALYMIAPQAIDSVRIEAPAEVARGDRATCAIRVVDSEGRPIDAVVPLEVKIHDAEGRLAEFSGYYGAAGGTVELTLDIAKNDPFGVWQLEVRDLASGTTAVHSLRVLGPKPWPPGRETPSDELANPVQPDG